MGKKAIAEIIALFQASYPTRRLTKEMLSLAALAYERHLGDLPDDAIVKAAHIAIREDDSDYRDWPSPGQIRAIAERILGLRISGAEAVRLAARCIRSEPVMGDYRYTLDVSGLSQPVAESLREALRRFGLRRFAEMDEEKRAVLFAKVYNETARELRERAHYESLPAQRSEHGAELGQYVVHKIGPDRRGDDQGHRGESR